MKHAWSQLLTCLTALSPLSAHAAWDVGGETTVAWVASFAGLCLGIAVVMFLKLRRANATVATLTEDLATRGREAETLLAVRDQYAAVLDAIPLPVWWRDRGLGLIGCNAAYCAALETDCARVLADGSELGAGVIDGDGRGLAARARQTGIALSESHYVIHSGARRLLEFTEGPLASGEAAVVGFAQDVSALEEVQSELATHIAAHGEVLETLGTAIAIFGPDRRLKFFNTAFLQLWDLDALLLDGEPTIGELMEILRERRVLPEYVDFPAFKQETDRLFVSVIERLEELLHLPDGRTLRRVVTPHPFGGLLFLYEDVTDRLVLERSYNTLIEVQRETLNNLYEGVAVYGQDGRLRLWNPTLLEMWGIDSALCQLEPHISEVLEQTRPLFSEAEDWPALKERLVLTITEGRARAGRLDRVDGTVLDFACVPLPDGGCLVSYIDVTDTARVQRALEERNLALEMADQVKTEFIANVSYELRTPLNTIAGFTDVLDSQLFGPLNLRQKEYVGGIVTASRQLMELIDDILDLATIEAGYMALNLREVNVIDIMHAVREAAAAKIESDRLVLEIDCPPETGAVIADEVRLTKAVFNLLWNAVMFQSSGGTITLRARRRSRDVTVEVDDSSGLVVAEESDETYDTFEHGDPYVRRTGAGLGLALTRSLVELHGGSLDITSEPGRGTRAVVRFPIAGPVSDAVKNRAAE